MEEHNIFIIILIIILLFFLSADRNITSETLDHNTIPLLLVLFIFYFCINNISLGVLLIFNYIFSFINNEYEKNNNRKNDSLYR